MPNSNIPGWAPRAPMIVTSDRKMSFFAKANAVRAGIRGSYGALSGESFGGVRDPSIRTRRYIPAARTSYAAAFSALAGLGDDSLNFTEGAADTVAAGGLIYGERSGSPDDVKMGGSTQSVADFAARLSNTVRSFVSGATGGAGGAAESARPTLPWWQIALVVGGVAVVGGVVWKVAKK